MENSVTPFATQFTFDPPALQPSDKRLRRLSDMVGLYADEQATRAMLAEEDRVIYEVLAVDLPESAEHLLHCVTLMYPGRVGAEYFMTSGHFHQDPTASEVYYGLSGEGMLLMQTRAGECQAIKMSQGTVAYIPPGWAHRTVNTGSQPFIFLAVWPGSAGHDYGSIKETGFAKLVVEQEGQAQVIDNPTYS